MGVSGVGLLFADMMVRQAQMLPGPSACRSCWSNAVFMILTEGSGTRKSRLLWNYLWQEAVPSNKNACWDRQPTCTAQAGIMQQQCWQPLPSMSAGEQAPLNLRTQQSSTAHCKQVPTLWGHVYKITPEPPCQRMWKTSAM